MASIAPLDLFVPYDVNIKLKRPAKHNLYVGLLAEGSYNVKGWAVNDCNEELPSQQVNSLQIYECQQNLISMYQGFDANGNLTVTPGKFTQLIDSIASGPGGGVSNYQNGLYTPTGKLSASQIAFATIYGLGRGFYIQGYLPFYFTQLRNVCWNYSGNNTLFSGALIQQELINSFAQDSCELFDLYIYGWKRSGPGDLTVLIEWQQDFIQRRPMLKSVQPNIRFGLSFPTGLKTDNRHIMSMPFGADGAFTVPFAGSLTLNLANRVDLGFSAQFWYFANNQLCRRIKTFSSQTSLLYPVQANVQKDFAILQNFNLFAQIYSFCNRLGLKACYQYWRQGEDTITPINSVYSYEIANSAPQLFERTQHDLFLALTYSPLRNDFKRIIPQAQLFVKWALTGTRTNIASTVGGQFGLIF